MIYYSRERNIGSIWHQRASVVTPILTPIDLEELTVNLNTLYPPYQLMRYIIFVWKGHENMFSCTGSRVKPVMREIRHVLDASSEFRVPQSEATSPPTNVSSVLTTRRWPIRQETDWPYCIIRHTNIRLGTATGFKRWIFNYIPTNLIN